MHYLKFSFSNSTIVSRIFWAMGESGAALLGIGVGGGLYPVNLTLTQDV